MAPMAMSGKGQGRIFFCQRNRSSVTRAAWRKAPTPNYEQPAELDKPNRKPLHRPVVQDGSIISVE